MKRTVMTILLATLLLAAMVVSSQATDMEHQHPGGEASMPSSDMHEMMMQRMETMQDKEMMVEKPCMVDKPCIVNGSPCPKPCMVEGTPPARHHRRGAATPGMIGAMGMGHDMMPMQPGMMQHRMDHVFFLDRAEELELTAEQVSKLKALRSACRKENIGKAAEAQVARLELQDLLDESDWSLKDAEPLIRQVQTLEGDMLLRHLQAKTEARAVLTAEQLQKADSAGDDLEELFK